MSSRVDAMYSWKQGALNTPSASKQTVDNLMELSLQVSSGRSLWRERWEEVEGVSQWGDGERGRWGKEGGWQREPISMPASVSPVCGRDRQSNCPLIAVEDVPAKLTHGAMLRRKPETITAATSRSPAYDNQTSRGDTGPCMILCQIMII